LDPVAGSVDPVAIALKRALEKVADIFVIIDKQDASFARAG
jgi:hypothetical protein